ncbi:MAG: phosphoheptose isomerase [Magnetovibrio sp.]|nr:phosphoheptose isomerase [Magnetovibrio sp.]|tara:strand:+ start:1108 stop:1728 length:621 start_codon:yes stop_codon:yes gene_type:complete
MTFPNEQYRHISEFADDYFQLLASATESLDRSALIEAATIVKRTFESGSTLFACGNGGSAAISNHLHCDHLKGVQTDTKLKPKVVSLSAGIETITAIANDISFEEVFIYQLKTLASSGDTLITISSSGDSENVVSACQWAKENGVTVIAMTGFSGGRSRKIADVCLHVEAQNYGIIEDVHQSIMHILAQFIRQEEMDARLINERKF